MELDTRAIGVRIYSMDLVKRSGQMVVDIKATISRVKSMVKEHIPGQMARFTTGIGMKTGSKAMVPIHGLTDANT